MTLDSSSLMEQPLTAEELQQLQQHAAAANISTSEYLHDNSTDYIDDPDVVISNNNNIVMRSAVATAAAEVVSAGICSTGDVCAAAAQFAAATSSSTAVPGVVFPSNQLDVDSATDSNRDTALTLGCAGGHDDMVRLLINRGANIGQLFEHLLCASEVITG